jgi:hypothetical protein
VGVGEGERVRLGELDSAAAPGAVGVWEGVVHAVLERELVGDTLELADTVLDAEPDLLPEGQALGLGVPLAERDTEGDFDGDA